LAQWYGFAFSTRITRPSAQDASADPSLILPFGVLEMAAPPPIVEIGECEELLAVKSQSINEGHPVPAARPSDPSRKTQNCRENRISV